MIGVTRDGHVMTLEMQRADRRNALNGALVDGLREAIEKAAAEDVRAIVLTGQGHVFSSGADLTDAPASIDTAGRALDIIADIALHGDADLLRRDRIEVVSTFPEVAIHDAVGVRLTELPMKPEAVLRAIRAAQGRPLAEG